MKNNTVFVILFLVFLALTLSSCRESTDSSRLQIETAGISVPHAFSDLACTEDALITVGVDGIHTVSLAADSTAEKLADFPCSAVDTAGNEIFCYGDGAVQVYGRNGKDKETYRLSPEEYSISEANRIVGGKKYIVLFGYRSGSQYLDSRMLLIDRKNAEITDITDTLNQNHEINLVRGADFVSDSQLVMIVKPDTTLFTDGNLLVWYDLSEKRMEWEEPLPNSAECCFRDGYVYYMEGEFVKKFDSGDGSRTLIKHYSREKLEQETGCPWPVTESKLFVLENHLLLSSPVTGAVYIDRLRYDSESVRILTPDNVNFFWENQEDIILFEEENRISVEIQELPLESFKDKLILRYLERDDSFDLVFIPRVNNDLTMKSILDKKLFRPLNDYTEIAAVLEQYPVSGELAEYQGSLYGLPWVFNYYYLEENGELWDTCQIPGRKKEATIEDVWEWCEYIAEHDLPVTVFNDDREIIAYMINQWIENDVTDKSRLSEIIGNVQKYAGILAPFSDGSFNEHSENALFQINWKYSFTEAPDDPADCARYPLYKADAANYVNVNSLILVNPFSEPERADAAVSLLCRLAEAKLTASFSPDAGKLERAKPYLISGSMGEVVAETVTEIYRTEPDESAEKIYEKVNMLLNE